MFNLILKDVEDLYLCNDNLDNNIVKGWKNNNGILEGEKNTSDISIDGPNYFNKAFRFDGVKDRINIGRLVSKIPEATIICWVRTLDEVDDRSIISTNNRDGQSLSIRFDRRGYYNKEDKCFKGSGTGNTTESSGNSAVKNTWTFVALTRDLEKTLLYINGILDSKVSIGKQKPLTDDSDLFLGYGSNGTGIKYGKIDIAGVFIFTRKLSPEEILEIYNGPEPINKVLPELTINQDGTWKGTVGEWDLIEPFNGMLNGEFQYSWDLYNGNNIVSSGIGIPVGDNLSNGDYYLSVKAFNNGGHETVKSLVQNFSKNSSNNDNIEDNSNLIEDIEESMDDLKVNIQNLKNILLKIKHIADSII